LICEPPVVATAGPDEFGVSFITLVFLRMTWHKGDFGPTVVARCIDIRLAMVPANPKVISSEPLATWNAHYHTYLAF